MRPKDDVYSVDGRGATRAELTVTVRSLEHMLYHLTSVVTVQEKPLEEILGERDNFLREAPEKSLDVVLEELITALHRPSAEKTGKHGLPLRL
eukprot:m.414004 g.414004  ORF g.414004 m.414004 type:complete len:93 (+) comp29219_c0_seq1:655-933(+)